MTETRSFSADNDLRPVVRTPGQGNLGLYVFGAILLVGGLGVFSALSAGREAASVPVTSVPASDGSRISSPPPLVLPQGFADSARAIPEAPTAAPLGEASRFVSVPETRGRIDPVPLAPFFAPPTSEPAFALQPVGPRTIYSQPNAAAAPAPTTPSALAAGDRVQASRLERPSLTVPQGTVIPAVLETAFDSTRPGSARALVQRDVYSFDGTRVLIPRGSRLYGTSEGGLNLGQRRAAIRWTRLLRPDGVTIALDSPASDPLGRAGVTGDVDSRFFTRFGGAILQSLLDLGVGAAIREASDGVIVALPGSTQNVTGAAVQNVQPVLRVDQGASVSVFVARDLDFSAVE
jgi:type IV secretion system protein VirB10